VIAVKLIALLVALFFTILNTYSVMLKNGVEPISILLQVLSTFVFLVLQFRLYE
jgi:ABC-type proline/glycine betaine transport system permease subunit